MLRVQKGKRRFHSWWKRQTADSLKDRNMLMQLRLYVPFSFLKNEIEFIPPNSFIYCYGSILPFVFVNQVKVESNLVQRCDKLIRKFLYKLRHMPIGMSLVRYAYVDYFHKLGMQWSTIRFWVYKFQDFEFSWTDTHQNKQWAVSPIPVRETEVEYGEPSPYDSLAHKCNNVP